MRRPTFRCLHSLGLGFLSLVLFWSSCAMADVLAGWDVSTQSGYGTATLAPTTANTNVAVAGLMRGSGVGTSGLAMGGGWGGVAWTATSEAAAIAGGYFATFSVTANGGSQVSFGSISQFNYFRSTSGPSSGAVQYSVNGGPFLDITTLSYAANTNSSVGPISLSGIAALQNVPAGTTVTFRIVNWNGTSPGSWYIYNVNGNTGDDLEISGAVTSSGPVNGACGSANGAVLSAAPSSNLCQIGTASAVSGSGPWNWSCGGSGGGTTAMCSATAASTQPLTIYHMNDVHARLTPHPWVINQHGTGPDQFEQVGGAAYLAGELLPLVQANPTALVLDGGDISEGNPLGDMNCTTSGGQLMCVNAGYGNGGMTAVYTKLHQKLTAIGGARGSRGLDALVVGNHDVRDVNYINNLQLLASAGVPVISANVVDIATGKPHFPPYTTVLSNGHKIGIIGYTTPTATVGASLANTLTVISCQWTGSSLCNISDYVNTLRNTLGCDLVILLTHDGHSDLVDPETPVLADTADAKLPEIAITGHWHTWAGTLWQPQQLNYKTMFSESSSYMNYLGELHVDAQGHYVSSTQHVLRNADITPDADIQAMIDTMTSQYNTAHPGHPVDEVVGYSNDDLLLDNRMKWWSADEYPWDGNNSAGQWITDAMNWKCGQIAWPSGGGCDLAMEAGGGVRADIPAGPVTFIRAYETYPWVDDTYVRVSMTGQEIINFINATNLDTGFSSALDVTAFDGVITSVLMNGQAIGLATVYKVAINNYMLANPPGGYTWPADVVSSAESDPSGALVRDSLSDFMRAVHATPATAYSVGGSRYHFNGQYSGGYRAVVTMMNDADTETQFEDGFIRLLGATPETLGRLGSQQVPASLVNADGSVVSTNRLAEQELYRSYLGFKTGALHPGDIIETYGKASFFGGDPEFVDQEGIYGDGIEFNIVGHDDSLAKPAFMSSIGAFFNNNYKNHYVKFLAKKTGSNTVVDQNGTSLTIEDKTAYVNAVLPGNVGDTLEITGIPTMENFALRFRSDSSIVSTAALPAPSEVTSTVNELPATSAAAVATLTATTSLGGGGYALVPKADAQVESGTPGGNFGTSTNLFVESTASGSFGIERGWLNFDLSGIPAGSTIASATLQLWNWSSKGPAMPTEVRGETDNWTETGITWNNQPALGNVLDTQTLASGVTNTWYSWNVTSFVQGEINGDKSASFLVKAADESQGGSPSYAFDSKEYGSGTAPVLQVQIQSPASSVTGVGYFYRYSTDNATWGTWTSAGAGATAAPYALVFTYPNGPGYYEFYSVATDNLGHTEPTPAYAETSVHVTAPSGSAQTISFATPPATPVGSAFTIAASASSAMAVTFTSKTTNFCSVSGSQITTLAVGTCTIAADQGGDVGYWLPAAEVLQSFTVTGLPQSISFGQVMPVMVNATGSLAATATSGLTVTFSSRTPAICNVNGAVFTGLAAGTCTIAADQAGDATHWAAALTVTQDVTVSLDAQSITFPTIPEDPNGSGTVQLSATSSSGLTVTFTSQTPAVCTVSGTTVTVLGTGTCTLVAMQGGNGTYGSATPVTESFQITNGSASSPDSDGPMPPWSLLLLGVVLAGLALHKTRRAS